MFQHAGDFNQNALNNLSSGGLQSSFGNLQGNCTFYPSYLTYYPTWVYPYYHYYPAPCPTCGTCPTCGNRPHQHGISGNTSHAQQ